MPDLRHRGFRSITETALLLKTINERGSRAVTLPVDLLPKPGEVMKIELIPLNPDWPVRCKIRSLRLFRH
jgi:hypothetical protein